MITKRLLLGVSGLVMMGVCVGMIALSWNGVVSKTFAMYLMVGVLAVYLAVNIIAWIKTPDSPAEIAEGKAALERLRAHLAKRKTEIERRRSAD